MAKKVCKLSNKELNWVMSVDEREISFEGYFNAVYFKEHYEGLGYEVIINQDEEEVRKDEK